MDIEFVNKRADIVTDDVWQCLVAGQIFDIFLSQGRICQMSINADQAIKNDLHNQKISDDIMTAWRGGASDLCLIMAGSDFQISVWKALLDIPYGQTRTYRDIAHSIGRPMAMRAVGNANGANPIALLVPCHRVVPAHGGIGGYAYGSAVKKALLDAEARALAA